MTELSFPRLTVRTNRVAMNFGFLERIKELAELLTWLRANLKREVVTSQEFIVNLAAISTWGGSMSKDCLFTSLMRNAVLGYADFVHRDLVRMHQSWERSLAMAVRDEEECEDHLDQPHRGDPYEEQ